MLLTVSAVVVRPLTVCVPVPVSCSLPPPSVRADDIDRMFDETVPKPRASVPPFTVVLPVRVFAPVRVSVPMLLFVKPLVPARPEVIVSVSPLATSMTDWAVPASVRICVPAMV